MQTKKVLIFYAPFGSGHRVVAEAIEEELVSKGVKTKTVDFFTLSKAAWARNLNKVNPRSKTFGAIYDFVWTNIETANFFKGAFPLFLPSLIRSFEKLIEHENPDVVVSTQAIPALVISLIKKRKRPLPHFAVLTDFRAHPYWPTKGVDLYFASSLGAKLDLVKSGVNPVLIKLTGIPVRKQFEKRFQAKKPGRTLKIVLLGGSYENAPYSLLNIQDLLSPLALTSKKLNLEITVVCGNNASLKRQIEKSFKGNPRIRTEGFVKDMGTFLSKSDLLISKAGGLISTEAIKTKTPIIIIGEARGQEKKNNSFLVNNGLGIEARSPQKLASLLKKLARSPKIIKEMSQKMGRFAFEKSASEVAKAVLS